MTDRLEESTGQDKHPARNTRLIAAAVLGGLIALFALLNTGDVRVNWLLGTKSTPLIVVIALSFLLGAGFGAMAARRRLRRDHPS
jgi:uncharacterized integral membrane protein